MIPEIDSLLNDSEIVNPLTVFVDYGNVIEVQADMVRVLPMVELFCNGIRAGSTEFQPLQTGGLYQSKAVLIDNSPDDRFYHRQIGHVEGRNS